MNLLCPSFIRRKAVWGPKRIVWPLLIVLLGIAPVASAAGRHYRNAPKKKAGVPSRGLKNYRLDSELERRSGDRNGAVNKTRVIVELVPGARLPEALKHYMWRFKKVDGINDEHGMDTNLGIINGQVLELPNNLLAKVANCPDVFPLHLDRPIKGHVYRTSVTVGARTVQESLGYTGKGVSVAGIDSGITTWHDDLPNKNA